MKHTLRITILVVLFCAAAVQSWASIPNATITKGDINGGTVKIYAQDPTTNTSPGEIADAPAGNTVYLVAEADYQHTSVGIDWRVMKSGSSSVAQSRTRSVDYAEEITVTNVAGNVYSFTMPTGGERVTVSATFAGKPTAQTTYIDPTKPAGQQECSATAYILDGTEQSIGADGKTTWYISNTTGNGLAYNSQIMIMGNVHLILADNSSMTVTIANDHPIYIYQGSADNPNRLHIYGQGGTTEGKLTATSESGDAINGNFDTELIINGGIINATGSSGINVTGSGTVTINGGNITATSIGNNAHPYGIYGSNGITINGGQVIATSTGGGYGIATTNSYITLGFSKTTDFIYANSYNTSSSNLVKTADGQRFAAYNMASEGDLSVSAIVSGSSKDSDPVSFTLDDIAGKTLRPIAVAEPDGQGGTTVSPGYLLSINPGDIAPADKTDSQGQPAPDFTITTGTGDNQVTTPYYIYKAGSEGTTIPLSVPDYGQQGADFTVSINGAADTSLPDAAVSGSGETLTAALPWTGANDVELKSARYYCTGVKYLDWNYTTKQLVPATTYVDTVTDPNDPSANSPAPGNTIKVYILTGGTGEDLPGGWYVVKNWNTIESNNSGIDAFYTSPVNFTGDTHLILGDKATMSVGTATTHSTGDGILQNDGSLAIHAQSTDDNMGTLSTFTGNDQQGICTNPFYNDISITINGGNIFCDVSEGNGIMAFSRSYDASVIINGGNITVKGDNNSNGIRAFAGPVGSVTINGGCVDLNVGNNGIQVYGNSSSGTTSKIAIYGGKVKDNSGLGFKFYSSNSDGEIILGWTNLDDFVYTTNYDVNGTVRIVDGQYLMACTDEDGSGPAYHGTLDATAVGSIAGKYLRPAMYTISAHENVNLSVADGDGTVDPVMISIGGIDTPYYIYKEGLKVTASLTNKDFVTNFEYYNGKPDASIITVDGVGTGNRFEKLNAITFTMPDEDFIIIFDGLRMPTGGKQYLAFIDDQANVTTSDGTVAILVFLGLQKNPTTGAIEARFTEVSEVPEDLPVIFASTTDGGSLPAAFPVKEDNSASANTLANEIKAAASPLFMTGTAGQTVADVLRAALTDAAGNPLLDSNNLPLSLDAADYVIFLFDADKFVPVAASASSKLTGRRYLLAVDKVTLLQFLNGSGSAARSLSSTAARSASATDRVWTFPVMVGGNSNGITNLTIDTGSPDGDWYSIDGRRLDTAPRTKGVYIHKDKVVVVKY